MWRIKFIYTLLALALWVCQLVTSHAASPVPATNALSDHASWNFNYNTSELCGSTTREQSSGDIRFGTTDPIGAQYVVEGGGQPPHPEEVECLWEVKPQGALRVTLLVELRTLHVPLMPGESMEVWEQDSQGSIIHKDSIGLNPEAAFHGYYDSSTAAVHIHFKGNVEDSFHIQWMSQTQAGCNDLQIQENVCSPDMADKYLRQSKDGHNCGYGRSKPNCAPGFFGVERWKVNTCCPGYFCPDGLVCMLPCSNGSFCPWPSISSEQSPPRVSGAPQALNSTSALPAAPPHHQPHERALVARLAPPSPTHSTSPNSTLPHAPPPMDRDHSASLRRCWPYSAPPADFTFLHAAEATAALPGPGEGWVCGGASTATEYCQEGYFCLTPLQRDICPKDYYCREGSTDPTRCPMLSVCQAGTAAPTLSFWEATLDLVIFVIAAGAHWLFTWARDVQRYRRAVVRQEAEPDWPQPISKMIQYVRLPGYWGALLLVALPLLVLLPSSATTSALSPEPRDGIPYPALLKGFVVGGPAMFLLLLAWACQPQSGPYNARSQLDSAQGRDVGRKRAEVVATANFCILFFLTPLLVLLPTHLIYGPELGEWLFRDSSWKGVLHACVPLVGVFVIGDLYFVMRVKLGLRVRAAQSAVALLLLVGLPLCVMFPMMHNARLLRLHTNARNFVHLCIWVGPTSFVLWEVLGLAHEWFQSAVFLVAVLIPASASGFSWLLQPWIGPLSPGHKLAAALFAVLPGILWASIWSTAKRTLHHLGGSCASSIVAGCASVALLVLLPVFLLEMVLNNNDKCNHHEILALSAAAVGLLPFALAVSLPAACTDIRQVYFRLLVLLGASCAGFALTAVPLAALSLTRYPEATTRGWACSAHHALVASAVVLGVAAASCLAAAACYRRRRGRALALDSFAAFWALRKAPRHIRPAGADGLSDGSAFSSSSARGMGARAEEEDDHASLYQPLLLTAGPVSQDPPLECSATERLHRLPASPAPPGVQEARSPPPGAQNPHNLRRVSSVHGDVEAPDACEKEDSLEEGLHTRTRTRATSDEEEAEREEVQEAGQRATCTDLASARFNFAARPPPAPCASAPDTHNFTLARNSQRASHGGVLLGAPPSSWAPSDLGGGAGTDATSPASTPPRGIPRARPESESGLASNSSALSSPAGNWLGRAAEFIQSNVLDSEGVAAGWVPAPAVPRCRSQRASLDVTTKSASFLPPGAPHSRGPQRQHPDDPRTRLLPAGSVTEDLRLRGNLQAHHAVDSLSASSRSSNGSLWAVYGSLREPPGTHLPHAQSPPRHRDIPARDALALTLSFVPHDSEGLMSGRGLEADDAEASSQAMEGDVWEGAVRTLATMLMVVATPIACSQALQKHFVPPGAVFDEWSFIQSSGIPGSIVHEVALGSALTLGWLSAAFVWHCPGWEGGGVSVRDWQQRRALLVLGLWLAALPAVAFAALESIDLTTPWTPTEEVHTMLCRALLTCLCTYCFILMAAKAGLQVVRAQHLFPLSQPRSLSTGPAELLGSTLILGLGRFGAKLFGFPLDPPNSDAVLFEEVLDRSVALHQHSRHTAHDSTHGRWRASRLTVKEHRVHFRFVDLGLMLKNGKVVLHGVTGEIAPAQITAVMGPSGAGKTTFMMTLAGKAAGQRLGKVLVNGVACRDLGPHRRMTGFVPQEDVMHRNLTVGENLQYAATLRVPWFKEPHRICREVLLKMQLYKYRYSIVGDETTRGISGGQRKRLNIGMELVSDPTVLFLDEPTSGLDSSTSRDIMEVLQGVASLGVTVVAVLHQPRYEIFAMFDTLLLLGAGRTVFMGPTLSAVRYFQSLDYVCHPLINQADFLMDCVAGETMREDNGPRFTCEELAALWEEQVHTLTLQWGPNMDQGLQAHSHAEQPPVWTVSWMAQLQVCTVRAIVQQMRGIALPLNAALVLLAGGLLGQLYSDVQINQVTNNNFLTSLAIGLTSVQSSLACFAAERPVFWREANRGMSKSAYFLAKNISQIPYMCLAPLIYLSLYYTFTAPRATFGYTYLILAAAQFSTTGIGNLVSIVTPPSSANVAAVVIVLVANMVAGYNPKLADLKEMHMLWMAKLSYARWLLEALFINEMSRYPSIWSLEVDRFYHHFGYTASILHMHKCMINMTILGGVFRMLAYIALLYTNKAAARAA